MTRPTTLAHLKKMSSRSSKNRLAPAPRFDRSPAGQARKAFAGLLEKGIPDLAGLSRQFDEIARKSQADAAREAKKNRALALKHSRDQKKVVAEAIAARMQAFDLLAAEPGVDSRVYYFLNSPFEIAANFNLTSSAIVPANSRAEFESEESGGFDYKQVYFNFYWVNPFDRYVVFNVSAYAVVNGLLQLEADGGVFPFDRFARAYLRVQLNVEDWTTEPFRPLGYQVQYLFDEKEDRSGFWDAPVTSLHPWFRGCDMQQFAMVIQPRGMVGIGVTIELGSETEDGRVYADFSNGDYRVSSPGVLVTVVS